jgi:LacI family transcriptional regulator
MPRVGVIVNNVEGYARGILRGVMPFAFARQWECSVMGVGLSPTSDNTSRFDGIIAQTRSIDQLYRLLGAGVPLVNVSSSLQVDEASSVVCDDLAVGRLGAEHFIRRGFRRFVWYAPLVHHFAKLRQMGFTSRLGEAAFEPVIVIDRNTLNALLPSLDPPTAVMCCNDISALEVLEQCRLLRLRVPDQIAVLGVDNDDLIQSLASPPLSTITTAAERIGFESAVLLERLMHNRGSAAGSAPGSSIVSIKIPPLGIVTRQSTDLIAVADDAVAEALRFIRQHAAGPMGVQDVQQHVTVSRRQLERRFRAVLGRSLLEEIRYCRVERARQLLIDTDLTIPQIATASGFSSASYLTVVFSRIAGESPGNFRKNVRRLGVFQRDPGREQNVQYVR